MLTIDRARAEQFINVTRLDMRVPQSPPPLPTLVRKIAYHGGEARATGMVLAELEQLVKPNDLVADSEAVPYGEEGAGGSVSFDPHDVASWAVLPLQATVDARPRPRAIQDDSDGGEAVAIERFGCLLNQLWWSERVAGGGFDLTPTGSLTRTTKRKRRRGRDDHDGPGGAPDGAANEDTSLEPWPSEAWEGGRPTKSPTIMQNVMQGDGSPELSPFFQRISGVLHIALTADCG